MDWPLRFGIFLAPFHALGQNPTLALERDLDLVVHLDRLGFHEAWIGEHHSAGVELIASPEVFIAVAAERTRHIRLGSGVSSLPYHQPLLLADRFVLLDHLTRGRVMLGCGPGQLTSDARMLGIPADTQRPRMEEALEAIVRLLAGETVTMRTDWFTLDEARLQLRPYSDPCFELAVAASVSPAGPAAAGRFGLGMLSVAATTGPGRDLLAQHWQVLEEGAEHHGHVADRRRWRLVGPMHLAETEAQAIDDVRYGLEAFDRYFGHILPFSPTGGSGDFDTIIEHLRETGFGVVGTPEQAIAQIQQLVELSDGGFGTFLLFGHEWADPEATSRSYELFARYVMPHFDGQLAAPTASSDWVTGSGGEFKQLAANAIGKAITDHAARG